MAEAKSYNVNTCDALVTFGCVLRGCQATLTSLGISIPIEFLTSVVHETHTLSQHEHNVGIQPHGDRGELFSSSGGLKQSAN